MLLNTNSSNENREVGTPSNDSGIEKPTDGIKIENCVLKKSMNQTEKEKDQYESFTGNDYCRISDKSKKENFLKCELTDICEYRTINPIKNEYDKIIYNLKSISLFGDETSNLIAKKFQNKQKTTMRPNNDQPQNQNVKNDHDATDINANTLKIKLLNQKNGIPNDSSPKKEQPTTEKEINSILKSQFRSKTKVIVLHGPSASGKSTLARDLKDALSKKYKVFVMSTDSFYKSFTGDNINDWDFDNPGAIDWDNAHKTLRAIHDKNFSIPYYEYSFINHRSKGPFYIKNTKPDIIIVEGILALNLFSECHFVDFSPVDPNKGIISRNSHSYPNFSVLKIKLSICRDKMRDIKIKRDIAERGRTYERSLYQFESQVWPATVKYVENPIFKADIHLVHGTFNINGYNKFFSAITKYFLDKSVFPAPKSTYLDVIGCHKECFHHKVDGLILWDH